jgi:iron complex transport system substrate-binding protein
MSLNAPVPTSPPARTVTLSWFVGGLLVVAGVAIAGTAAYSAFRSTSSPNLPPTPGNLSVTDDLGRTVTVPHDPARVAVLSPSVMDTLFRLGLRSHVVGIDCSAVADGGLSGDYSPDQVTLWGLSSSMCVQVIPSLAPEMLENLTPDLVLASTIISVAQVETISSTLGIPVVMLQPPTLSGILVDVNLVGEIFGVPTAAASLNAALSLELYNATQVDLGSSSFPTVLLTIDADPNGYWTYGPGTFGESLIEIAGGTSISANATTPYPELSPAQILLADPSVIVYGTGFGLNETTYTSGPLWSDFSAVQDGNVSGINSNWLTEPDPTMVLSGIPALLAAFHPNTS